MPRDFSVTTIRKLLYAFAVAGVVVVLLVLLGNGSAGQDAPRNPDKTTAPTTPKTEVPVTGPQTLPVHEEPKIVGKVITMAEAVTIAEKAVKGYTLRAERTERPVVGFRVEVVGMNGNQSVVDLSADGRVLKKGSGTLAVPNPNKKGTGGQKRMEREGK
jgi:hypothetical protein